MTKKPDNEFYAGPQADDFGEREDPYVLFDDWMKEAESHEPNDPNAMALATVDNPDDPAFASHPDQVDVPVAAGDVVVADARLIHGAYPNRSDAERTNITLWWHPHYADLPPELQAVIERLSYAADMETLRSHQAEAATLFAKYAEEGEP